MNTTAPSGAMRAALDAADGARGGTRPNPWVGASAVRSGRVVATGATEPPPGRHAERVALDAAGGEPIEALYATLEPCAPFEGKRTPSCAEAIVAAGVPRVVIALEDPDERVRGRGIAILRAAGVEVEVGDGAAAATAQLRPYVKHRRTGRPWVIAKFAASLDGRLSTNTGDSRWITGEAARAHVHEQRAHADAILTGSGTVLADDPALTARPSGALVERQPLRVVLDARGRVSPGARLLSEPGSVLVATTSRAPGEWRGAIGGTGAEVVVFDEAPGDGVDLDAVLEHLGTRGIITLWVEAGPRVLGALFDGGHADELYAYLAPVVVGGEGGGAVWGAGATTMAESSRLREVTVERLGEDVLVRGVTGR